MTAPRWASELVAAVCAEAGVTPPQLSWRRRRAEHSTGVARRSAGSISVRAGWDATDQRLTLLHELAHWLTPPPRRRRTAHHGRAFYRTAFALYRQHGIENADALRLEASRYPSSLGHAAALGVRGAADAAAERRANLRARREGRRWQVAVPEHPVRLVRDGRWHVCATCRQRIVGRNLTRVLRARRAPRHVLWAAVPVEERPLSA